MDHSLTACVLRHVTIGTTMKWIEFGWCSKMSEGITWSGRKRAVVMLLTTLSRAQVSHPVLTFSRNHWTRWLVPLTASWAFVTIRASKAKDTSAVTKLTQRATSFISRTCQTDTTSTLRIGARKRLTMWTAAWVRSTPCKDMRSRVLMNWLRILGERLALTRLSSGRNSSHNRTINSNLPLHLVSPTVSNLNASIQATMNCSALAVLATISI